MAFINWGHESEEQKKFRKFLDEESLMEQAINASQGRSGNAPGVGGGSLQYNRSNPTTQTTLVVFRELNNATYSYYIADYTNARIIGPFDTGVSVEDYSLDDLYTNTILYGGYGLRFYRGDINEHSMFFIDKDGMIVETIVAISTDVEMNDYDGKFIVASDYDENLLWIFDGTTVLTDTTVFEGVSGFSNGSNNFSAIPSGFGISTNTSVESGTLRKFYLCNAAAATQIYEFTETDENEEYVQFYLYNELDKLVVLTRRSDNSNLKRIEVVSATGIVEHTVTVNPNLSYPDLDLNWFGENNFFAHLRNGSDSSVPHLVYNYDGTANVLHTTTYDAERFTSWSYEWRERSNTARYNYPAVNNAVIVFYSNISSINGFRETDDCQMHLMFAGSSPVTFIFADGVAKKIYLSDEGIHRNFFLFVIDPENDNLMSSLVIRPDAEETYNTIVTNLDYSITNLDDIDITENGERVVLVIEYDEEIPVNTIISSFNSNGTRANGVLELQTVNHDTNTSYGVFLVDGDDSYDTFLNSSGNWVQYPKLGNYDSASYYVDLEEKSAPYEVAYGAPRVPYTHTQMSSTRQGGSLPEDYLMNGSIQAGTDYFGAVSNYFTNHYPGLFTLVAKSINIDSFTVNGTGGSLGADGDGSVVTETIPIEGYAKEYTAYVRLVYDTTDPSINQIIIIDAASEGTAHHVDLTNEDDFNELTGIGAATELHYLLFSTADSSLISEEQLMSVITGYLDLVEDQSITDTLSTLNSNYEEITGIFPAYDSGDPGRIFYFADAPDNGSDILEGGNDMYDSDNANSFITSAITGVPYKVYKATGSVSSFSVPENHSRFFGKNGLILLSDHPNTEDIVIRHYDLSGNLLATIDTPHPGWQDGWYTEDRGLVLTSEKTFDGEAVYLNHRMYAISPNGVDQVEVNLPTGGGVYRVIHNNYGWLND